MKKNSGNPFFLQAAAAAALFFCVQGSLPAAEIAAPPAASVQKTVSSQKAPPAASVQKNAPAQKKECSLKTFFTDIVTQKIVMYVPNIVKNTMEIFSISLRSGAHFGFETGVTHLCRIGAGYGPCGEIAWGPNGQYGVALYDGGFIQCLNVEMEDSSRKTCFGNMKQLWQLKSGFQWYTQKCFDTEKIVPLYLYAKDQLPENAPLWKKFDTARDYWAIEAGLTGLAGLKVGFHPVEFADLVCGIFFYDLLDDDFKLPADNMEKQY